MLSIILVASSQKAGAIDADHEEGLATSCRASGRFAVR
jgi:hypothetical protein